MNQKFTIQLLFVVQFLSFGCFYAGGNNVDSLTMEFQSELANRHSKAGDYDSCVYYLDRAIEMAQELNYATIEGDLMSEKALILFYATKKEEAIKAIKKSREVFRREKNVTQELYTYLILGYIYIESGDYKETILTYKEGLAIAEETGNIEKTSSLLANLSSVHQSLGDHESAAKYILEAIDFAEENNQESSIGPLYISLGSVYRLQENYELALDWYKKGLGLLEGKSKKRYKISCLRSMGSVYIELKEFELAKKAFNESYSIATDMAHSENAKGRHLYNIAKVHQEQGEIDSAINLYKQAIEITSRIKDAVFEGYSRRALADLYLNSLGTVASERQFRLKEASKHGEIAMELAQSSGSMNHISRTARILMDCYSRLRNAEKTSKYAELYGTSLDSLNKIENSKKTIELQTKFEVEKKELQIELLGKENALKEADLLQSQESEVQQQKIIIISIIALIISILSALFLLRLYGQKKKANAELEAKNALISEQKEEKEVLLKEIHHRVKNNLQVVSSLLDLQTNSIDDESTLLAIEDGQSRVQAMALIHQNLYQNQDIGSISFEEYANQLVKQLASVYESENKVEVELKGKNTFFDIDTAIPVGLILNELVSNAYKYAFKKEGQGKLNIQLEEVSKGEYALTVSDNGAGLPSDFEVTKAKSLGLRLVHRLSRQLYGQVEYLYEQGANFKILFKDTEQRKLIQ